MRGREDAVSLLTGTTTVSPMVTVTPSLGVSPICEPHSGQTVLSFTALAPQETHFITTFLD